MKYLDVTLSDPASNLALDEALLSVCETLGDSVLRIWESRTHFAVLGYSNRAALELDIAACEMNHIPVFRRCTGGGAVLQGPGCLNYALAYHAGNQHEKFHELEVSYDFVLRPHQSLFERILERPVEVSGTSDLAIDGWKFSGNSQYRRRGTVLFHGSFLLNLDISVVGRCLRMPSKQPSYRANRPHQSFMRNLLIDSDTVKQELRNTWQSDQLFSAVPWDTVADLVRNRYSRREWNFKF